MKAKRKETHKDANDIDMAIRMAQVAWHREKHKMLAAKAEADQVKAIVNTIGRENLSEQLRARYHTHLKKMQEQREAEESAARKMYRLELKLNRLKQIAGVIKTEAFSFLEDKAVTV